MNPRRLRAYILLLIVAVIWGIAGPVIKLTLKGLPPDIFLLYRFFVSSIVAIVIFIFRRGLKLPKHPKILFQIFLYCLLTSSIALGLLFWGTNKTTLLDMSLISLFGPLLMIIFGSLFLKDRITAREKVGIAIAFLGSAVIGITPIVKTTGSGQLIGNILIFASLLAGAVSGVLVKKLMREGVSPGILANLSFVVGFITLLPFVLLKYGPSATINLAISAPPSFQLGVFYMAVISGNIAYILSNIAQKTIELSEAAPFAYLYPIFSGILAITLLGDKLTLPIIIGSVTIFIGVITAEMKKRRVAS